MKTPLFCTWYSARGGYQCLGSCRLLPVRRIFKEAEEQNLSEPQIVEIGMRIRFIVPLAKRLKIPATREPGVKSTIDSWEETLKVNRRFDPRT